MKRRLRNAAVAKGFVTSNKIYDLAPCLSSDGLHALPTGGTQLEARA